MLISAWHALQLGWRVEGVKNFRKVFAISEEVRNVFVGGGGNFVGRSVPH